MIEKVPPKSICLDGPLPEGLAEAWEAFLLKDCDHCLLCRQAGLKDDGGTACEHCHGTGKVVCDRSIEEMFDHPLLFPLQRRRETEKMMATANAAGAETVMEIGADKGGGIYAWLKLVPTIRRMVVCEIRGTPYQRVFEIAFPNVQFLWLPESSYDLDVVSNVQGFLGKDLIDCLFIDGDKSAFLYDFRAYMPLVHRPGLVIMHDIRDAPGPKDAWDTVKRGFSQHCKEIIDVSEWVNSNADAEAGKPVRTCHEGWLRHWRGASCGVGIIDLPSGE